MLLQKLFRWYPFGDKSDRLSCRDGSLEVPRASEEETWDQICADFDKAIEAMMPKSPKRGYANKYVALAVKSQAMLYLRFCG